MLPAARSVGGLGRQTGRSKHGIMDSLRPLRPVQHVRMPGMPGGSDVSNGDASDDDLDPAEFAEASPEYLVSEYLVFFGTVVISLVVTDYSKTPQTMYAAVAVGLTYLFAPPSRRRALLWLRSGQAVEVDEEATQTLPVCIFAGTAFGSCLLAHAVADPSIAPDVFALVYKSQAVLSVTWFVLGFLGGGEAADPRLKVVGAILNGVIAWTRTRILDHNLPEPSCTQQFDTEICLPSLSQLAIRCQLAPAGVGFLLGWLSRAKWHAWNQEKTAPKDVALHELSGELAWLRSHVSSLEDARRDDLIRKESPRTARRASPFQPVQEASAEPQPDELIQAWAGRTLSQVGLPPPNKVGERRPSSSSASSSASSSGRASPCSSSDTHVTGTTHERSSAKSRPSPGSSSPRVPRARPLATVQEKQEL